MATTGLWPIKGNLKGLVKYAENPEKTIGLADVLHYAANEWKTEKCMYVTALNCPRQKAYECMMATKRRFGKMGGNVAYHGYQSLVSGEVTAEQALEIGKQTAQEMWGDRFEVLIAVHLNTDNIHCHYVVNSVSFIDGLKYSNKKSEHYRFREVSDRICKEYHLSVLENAPFYGSKKKEYWLHKDGRKTHRDILKQDIEYCLTFAGNMRDFISQFHGLGYEYDWQRDSVKATGWERAVRLKNLGYTPESLKERLDRNFDAKDYYYQWNTHLPYQPKRYPLLELEKQLQFSVEHSRDTATVLIDALFLIIVTLLQLQVEDTPVTPLSPAVRQELSRLDALQKEYLFLSKREIHTAKDLTASITEIAHQIEEKENQRQKYRNRLRRVNDPKREKELKEQAKAISAELKPLREDLQTAKRIEETYPKLQKLLETEHSMETNARVQERSMER